MKKLFIFTVCVLSFSFLTFALSESEAYAQSCHSTRIISKPVIHSPVVEVVKKEVINTVAVPVLVPAFQFQYQPPTFIQQPFAYGQQQFVTPQGQPYGQPFANPQGQPYGTNGQPFANPQGQPYGTNGQPFAAPQGQPFANPQGQPNQQSPFAQDRIRELAKALLEEMNKQSEADLPPPVSDGSTPANPQVNPQGSGPAGLNPGIQQMSAEQAASIAIPALKQNCAACHTGNGSKGDFVMFQSPEVFDTGVSWGSVRKEIIKGKMPPRDSQFRLTEQQRKAIGIWLKNFS